MSKRTEKSSWGDRLDLELLNTDIRRVDGPDKATGRAVYTHDVRLPGMLWARVLKHPVPRATIRSIDIEAANALPGVVHIHVDKEAGEEVRYSGDDSILAIVAAETPDAAMDAIRAIVVDAENHEPVVSTERAKEEDAPVISQRRKKKPSNLDFANESGDAGKVAEAMDQAAAVAEVTVEIPVQHHVCLETHGHVVDPVERDGFVHVYASTQNVSGMPGQFQGVLDTPADSIRVLTPHMGGGFGAKFGAGKEGQLAAIIAKKTGRPVHLMLSRSDEFQMAGNRSGSKQTIRLGANAEGKLIGIDLDAERHGGMGGGSLPGAPYRYDVPYARAKTVSVKTATDSSRAMRAPGHPQASFGMETAVDMVAYQLGMDVVELRKKNLASETHHRQLDRVAKEIGWMDHANRSKPGKADDRGMAVGIGFGVAGWSPGGRPSQCDVTVYQDGSIVSATATQDLGTGARTYVAAIVAEELGLPVTAVTARIGDSQLPASVPSGGSVTTGSSAPAIKDAAHKVREALEARLEPILGEDVGDYLWKEGRVYSVNVPSQSLAWNEVCAILRDPLVVRGEFQPHLYSGEIHGAQAAKVEIDTLTGRVKVLKMVGIHDQGLPLNRMALRSQINGGMIQALSYGLLEERVFDEQDGYLLSDNLDLYKIAGVQEMPEMVALIDDEDERDSVCGMAEASVIPGQSAIANAIYNACGVRITKMPFTANHVLEAIHGKV